MTAGLVVGKPFSCQMGKLSPTWWLCLKEGLCAPFLEPLWGWKGGGRGAAGSRVALPASGQVLAALTSPLRPVK